MGVFSFLISVVFFLISCRHKGSVMAKTSVFFLICKLTVAGMCHIVRPVIDLQGSSGFDCSPRQWPVRAFQRRDITMGVHFELGFQ